MAASPPTHFDEHPRFRRLADYRSGVVATAGREHVPYRRIAFPLARDGEHVDMVLFIFANDGKSPSMRNKR